MNCDSFPTNESLCNSCFSHLAPHSSAKQHKCQSRAPETHHRFTAATGAIARRSLTPEAAESTEQTPPPASANQPALPVQARFPTVPHAPPPAPEDSPALLLQPC